jgi:succinate dehydrogenase/fumarate reductase cytochrome b subunit
LGKKGAAMSDLFFHYVFFSSAVALYGIGFDRCMLAPPPPRIFLLAAAKNVVAVAVSVFFVFPPTRFFLVPLGMVELMPLCAVLVFIPLSVLLEAALFLGVKKTLPEFVVPFLCVLLALCESPTFGHAILAGVFSVVSYHLFAAIVVAVKKRLDFFSSPRLLSPDALLLVSVAVVVMILCGVGAGVAG